MTFQEALENSEAQFTLAARVARLGHWHADDLKGEYTTISEEYARIHGYTVDEYMERYRSIKSDWQTIHPEDRASVKKIYDRKISSRRSLNIYPCMNLLVQWQCHHPLA